MHISIFCWKSKKTFKYRNSVSQKFLCLRVWKCYASKKIAVQGIAKDVIFDSKGEQTEVPIFSFSTNIFGLQKRKYFLLFLTSFLHQIKARVYAQTVEQKSVHQTSHFVMNPLQPYLIMKDMHFFSTVCSRWQVLGLFCYPKFKRAFYGRWKAHESTLYSPTQWYMKANALM